METIERKRRTLDDYTEEEKRILDEGIKSDKVHFVGNCGRLKPFSFIETLVYETLIGSWEKRQVYRRRARNLPYEARVAQIEALVASGVKSAKGISQKAAVGKQTVYAIARKEGIELQNPYEARVAQIEALVASGVNTAKGISQKTNIRMDNIYQILRKEGLKITRHYSSSTERKKQILDLFHKGVTTYEAMSKETGLHKGLIKGYANKFGIELKGSYFQISQPKKRRPEIDNLILEGKTLQEIGDAVGLTRERIRQYINGSGQYDLYRGKRQEIEKIKKEINSNEDTPYNRKRNVKNVANLVRLLGLEKSKSEPWPVRKSLEYVLSRKGINIFNKKNYTVDDILPILKRYEEAKNNNKKLSLEELGAGTRLGFSAVSRVLKEVGLEPLYGTRERRSPLNNEEKKVILRVKDTKLTSPDVAYFSNLNFWQISQYLERKKKKIGRGSTIKIFSKNQGISYSLG